MHERKLPTRVAETQHLVWDDIKVFQVVATSGSMRRAASTLKLNASTVSRRLGALEEGLSARLFDRYPEGLKLTAAGAEVLQFAERLRGDVQQLQSRIMGRDQQIHGTVRVTVAEVVGAWVVRVLGEALERHDGLHVELTISDAMANVQQHEADIAVRVADAPPAQLVGRRLGLCSTGIYASTEYVARMGHDLNDPHQRWIAWPHQVEGKPAFRWLQAQYPARREVLRASSAHGVLHAVQQGLGIAPLACIQAANDPRLALLRRLPDDCATPIWVLTHKDIRKTARVQVVLQVLSARLVELRDVLQGQACAPTSPLVRAAPPDALSA